MVSARSSLTVGSLCSPRLGVGCADHGLPQGDSLLALPPHHLQELLPMADLASPGFSLNYLSSNPFSPSTCLLPFVGLNSHWPLNA